MSGVAVVLRPQGHMIIFLSDNHIGWRMRSLSSGGKYVVSDEQVVAYERDGVVFLPSVAGEEWIERVRGGIERSLIDDKTGEASAYFKRLRLWENDPELRDFCLHSQVPQIAAGLLNTDKVNLLYDQAFVKEPGTDAPTPWHNDQPYWPVRGTQVVTLWIAFDPVTQENGGLEFIRGSHKLSKWYRPWDTDESGKITELFHGDDDDQYDEMPDFAANRDQYDIVSWEMKPGDAVAFHALTVHGAPGNRRRDLRRRAYAIRMTGRNVRYYAGKIWNEYITNPALKTGDPLDSPQYPVLYNASQHRERAIGAGI
jgi:ectoine hydroxylase-related dioxygenase (phytanoyl-CoA dioxygenase family)